MKPINGPLRPHPTNPRYFTEDGEKAVYLTGSHTWANLQDIGLADSPAFPYQEYLDFMQAYHHNFMRLWMFEQPELACWTPERILFDPLPWQRTGPGLAQDGKPKFDLSTWNEAYFKRLRQRLQNAQARGIYAAVMLFQGWSLNVTHSESDPWIYHPFNPANNVNQVELPALGWETDEQQPTLHSLGNPGILAFQEAYVRKVIDSVNDLDNVLYEIINEGGTYGWQCHMIDFIHEYEGGKAKQHPVGMTAGNPCLNNASMYTSPADWISPAQAPNIWSRPDLSKVEDYKQDPPAADGSKVILPDTDHLWGHGGNARWAWKCFTRGHNPIFMDPWQALYLGSQEEKTPWAFTGGISKDWQDYPDWQPLRQAMGDTLRYAERMGLASMTPRPELVSSRYCLANPGVEYLVYLPEGGDLTINLNGADGSFAMEWYLPQLARTLPGARPLLGGDYAFTTAPFSGDAVLYLKSNPTD
jgi:hypothetical protein